MRHGLLLTCVLILLPAGGAFAQNYTQDEQEACQADAVRLCSEFVPDVDKVTTCMKAHVSNLSPECAQHFEEEKPRKGHKR